METILLVSTCWYWTGPLFWERPMCLVQLPFRISFWHKKYFTWEKPGNESSLTLHKLYAVPVRVCSTHEDMHYPWVISSVPVSHILSTRESYHQYPWVISSVPVRICSTHESYHQYLWGYAVPVSHIISTRESYPQYPWGYAVPVRICITREGSFIHSSFI